MRAARWSAVAVAVVFLAGCGQTHHATLRLGDGTDKYRVLSNRTYTVKRNDAIVVTLDSNWSTGYRWELAPSFSPSPVRFVSRRYVAPKKSVPGAAGKEIWRFRAVSHGRKVLNFLSVRPSQPG